MRRREKRRDSAPLSAETRLCEAEMFCWRYGLSSRHGQNASRTVYDAWPYQGVHRNALHSPLCDEVSPQPRIG